MNHLFFACHYAWKIWSHWLLLWGMERAFHIEPWSYFNYWINLIPTSRCEKVWLMPFEAVAWSIWLSWNERVFNNKMMKEGTTLLWT